MTIKNSSLKTCFFIFILVLAIIAVLPTSSTAVADALIGESTTVSLRDTNVLDDLMSSTDIDGNRFDVNDYPDDEFGTLELITFVEYCYSADVQNNDQYGLYLYIYNPQARKINYNSKQNKITMAVDFDDKGNAIAFEKFNLQFVNASPEPYVNRFLKYQIIDHVSELDCKTIEERVSSSKRKYIASEMEIAFVGEPNATAYGLGFKYEFTGFSKGFGANGESTLNATTSNNEELVKLDVHPTSYIFDGVSSLGKYHQDTINSVYFAVDNVLFEKYDTLQQIKAEWYEYKTSPIYVANSSFWYNQFIDHKDIYVGLTNTRVDDCLITYDGFDWQVGLPDTKIVEGLKYNIYYETAYDNTNIPCLPWVFYSADGKVSAREIIDYLYENRNIDLTKFEEEYYWKQQREQYPNGNYDNYIYDDTYININGVDYNSVFFADDVDAGRTQGYNVKTIDADKDTWTSVSYGESHDFWDTWWDYGFWTALLGSNQLEYDNGTVKPIENFEIADLALTAEEISHKYYVNEDDVEDLKSFVIDSNAKSKTVMMFRFAKTDYYTETVAGDSSNDDTSLMQDAGYIAQQTLFMDFDILQLNFKKGNAYHTIPIVSSPQNITSSTEPPLVVVSKGMDFFDDFWATLLAWFKENYMIFAYIAIGIAVALVLFVIIVIASKIAEKRRQRRKAKKKAAREMAKAQRQAQKAQKKPTSPKTPKSASTSSKPKKTTAPKTKTTKKAVKK